MNDTYVELNEIPIMRVKADMKGKGPSAAMDLLESKLPTLKGRKFYGVFHETPDGEEYSRPWQESTPTTQVRCNWRPG